METPVSYTHLDVYKRQEETDKMLHGYMRLITGRKDETVYRIAPTLD